MTMQPLQMPKLDPSNPYQMFDFWTGWLFINDPSALAQSDKEIGEWAAEETEIALEEGLRSKGFKRGDPQQRTEAYERKYFWPTARDPETGALLHPVMTQAPVLDELGQPTGEMRDVPTGEGEDLWREQQTKFPRQFHTDAMDAFKLGAPLPEWVLAYALANGAEPAVPPAMKALRDDAPMQAMGALY